MDDGEVNENDKEDLCDDLFSYLLQIFISEVSLYLVIGICNSTT